MSIYQKILIDSCLNCHYFRFAHFQKWCAHPKHHTKIRNEYLSCGDWIDMFTKKYIEYNKVPLEETLEKAREPA